MIDKGADLLMRFSKAEALVIGQAVPVIGNGK